MHNEYSTTVDYFVNGDKAYKRTATKDYYTGETVCTKIEAVMDKDLFVEYFNAWCNPIVTSYTIVDKK